MYRAAIERAFRMWSDVSPLTFSEVGSEADGDLKLEFVAGEHRDGVQNAFDGPGDTDQRRDFVQHLKLSPLLYRLTC